MPSMNKEQREEAKRKRANAVVLGQRPEGVTNVELAAKVGTKAVGAMEAILSRMQKANHVKATGDMRDGRKVWKATAAGVMAYEGVKLDSPKPKAEPKPDPKPKTRKAKKAAKTPEPRRAKVVDVRNEAKGVAKAAKSVAKEAEGLAEQLHSELSYVGTLEIVAGLKHTLSGVEKMLRSARMSHSHSH